MKDNYLMMSRVMGNKWKDYQKENVWGKGYTGSTELALEKAFKEAFMAGFYLKFTKVDEL